jgi:hypothetical protein
MLVKYPSDARYPNPAMNAGEHLADDDRGVTLSCPLTPTSWRGAVYDGVTSLMPELAGK